MRFSLSTRPGRERSASNCATDLHSIFRSSSTLVLSVVTLNSQRRYYRWAHQTPVTRVPSPTKCPSSLLSLGLVKTRSCHTCYNSILAFLAADLDILSGMACMMHKLQDYYLPKSTYLAGVLLSPSLIHRSRGVANLSCCHRGVVWQCDGLLFVLSGRGRAIR